MKSSKNNNAAVVDDISRETQRLISDSHVRLPYHKPKQKSLKDFLNRQKIILTECQASITGSKKLLHKAWELIESKEKNVEQFYNEDSLEIEQSPSKNDDKDIIIAEELKVTLSDNNVKSSCNDDQETSSCSDNDVKSSCNDDQETSSCSEKSSQQFLTHEHNEYSENNLNSNNFEEHNCPSSTKNKNESMACLAKQYVYELYDSSDYENSLSSLIDDEQEREEDEEKDDEDDEEEEDDDDDDDEEFFKRKKRKLMLLSESSDEENDSITDIKLTPNDLKPLFNDESQTNISTQQLMGLCSGEFHTQLTEEKIDLEDSFDSVVLKDDTDTIIQNEDVVKLPELISAKDFFENEAELSDSDWSSDEEEHLADKIDQFEAEAGDNDDIDESAIKNGLDKIYMRQLLDDDQKQVTTLKEMLFEEGDLYSDSSRKRKFQWETDIDDGAIEKPLFSDNDDEPENDEAIDTERWRNERFQRESYLSEKNKYADEYIEKMYPKTDSNDISQVSISAVKKTHIVKYRKKEIKNTSSNFENTVTESIDSNNENKFGNDKIISSPITVVTNTTINKMNINDLVDTPIADVVVSKPNKLMKGSFINRMSENKMNTTLLYINKKSIIINDDEKYEENNVNNEIKSMSMSTAKTSTNPFVYLLRNDKKQELSSDDLNNVENHSKSSIQSVKQLSQTYLTNNSGCSILKQLE